MHATMPLALARTLEFLLALRRDGIRPEEAQARLRTLREELGIAMDLLWEEEVIDRSVHYDVLLHSPPEGTVTLSFCADAALPWPMRGVQRWSEATLARVNGSALKVDQAVACLDFIWDESRITDRLVNVCLIDEELARHPIALSDEEIQAALDLFRRARKLFTADQTQHWMKQRGLTHQQLERLVEDEVLLARLRDRIVGDRTEAYFAQHRADFDRVALARIGFPDEQIARRAAADIAAGRLEFYEAAERGYLDAPARGNQPTRATFATVRRGETPREFQGVFDVSPGTLVGPVPEGAGWTLLRVLAGTPACLDEPTISAVKEALFAEWLAERRETATVEWYWGNAAQTIS